MKHLLSKKALKAEDVRGYYGERGEWCTGCDGLCYQSCTSCYKGCKDGCYNFCDALALW